MKLNASLCSYKRLGLSNVLIRVLIKISPNIRSDCNVHDSSCQDPVVTVNSVFLRKNSALIVFLEVIYKAFQYTNILLRSALNKTLIVDEGPSMGWANYHNLRCRGSLNFWQVSLLMALDLQALHFLTKFCYVELCFVDRFPEELIVFWCKRRHVVPYSNIFADMVRNSFKLLQTECAAFVHFNCVCLSNSAASQKLLASLEP